MGEKVVGYQLEQVLERICNVSWLPHKLVIATKIAASCSGAKGDLL
jgi:hypothetical protein